MCPLKTNFERHLEEPKMRGHTSVVSVNLELGEKLGSRFTQTKSTLESDSTVAFAILSLPKSEI